MKASFKNFQLLADPELYEAMLKKYGAQSYGENKMAIKTNNSFASWMIAEKVGDKYKITPISSQNNERQSLQMEAYWTTLKEFPITEYKDVPIFYRQWFVNRGLIKESSASEEAKKKGLTHKGFGRYADKSGKVVAKSEDGALVGLDKDKKTKKVNSRKENDDMPPSKIPEKIKRILKKHDIEPIKIIGEGGHGYAYVTKNGNILKVTNDRAEAKAMAKIKKHNLKNIVKPLKVLKDSKNFYYIEMEKLYPMPDSMMDDNMLRYMTEHLAEITYQENGRNIGNITKDDFEKIITNEYIFDDEGVYIYKDMSQEDKIETNKSIKKYLNQEWKKFEQYKKTNSKFLTDYVNGIDQLKDIGIEFKDTHLGNLMIDKDGNYKFIDIGYSFGAEKEKVKKMEQKEMKEEAERDYKDEYKKFQSSDKSKKYRAELNKYNRDKGTYGNGDGKDATHKDGEIKGFEDESANKDRREKSRLKKESEINEKFPADWQYDFRKIDFPSVQVWSGENLIKTNLPKKQAQRLVKARKAFVITGGAISLIGESKTKITKLRIREIIMEEYQKLNESLKENLGLSNGTKVMYINNKSKLVPAKIKDEVGHDQYQIIDDKEGNIQVLKKGGKAKQGVYFQLKESKIS